MSFESLEVLTETQVELSNILLLTAAAAASEVPGAKVDVRSRRRQQFTEFKAKLGPDLRLDAGFHELAPSWLAEENVWLNAQIQPLGGEHIASQLLYRLMVLMLRNHVMGPFIKKEKKLFRAARISHDLEDFEQIHDRSCRDLIVNLSTILSHHCPPEFVRFQEALVDLQTLSVDAELASARHNLLRQDRELLKRMALGGVIGVSSTIVLGPVIGTWIGNLAGLSGAAATSFGLALIGGGSLASG
jgi:hypothetical protein